MKSTTPPNDSNTPKNEGFKAGEAAAAGAAAGVVIAESLGGIGLCAAGTAFSIGAAPVVIAGAIFGLAGYGLYRAIVA